MTPFHFPAPRNLASRHFLEGRPLYELSPLWKVTSNKTDGRRPRSWGDFLFRPFWIISLVNVIGGGGLVVKSCPTLVILWTVAHQVPLPMGFSRQESWSGLPFPPPLSTLIKMDHARERMGNQTGYQGPERLIETGVKCRAQEAY